VLVWCTFDVTCHNLIDKAVDELMDFLHACVRAKRVTERHYQYPVSRILSNFSGFTSVNQLSQSSVATHARFGVIL